MMDTCEFDIKKEATIYKNYMSYNFWYPNGSFNQKFITTENIGVSASRYGTFILISSNSPLKEITLIGKLTDKIDIIEPIKISILASPDHNTYYIPELNIYSFAENYNDAIQECKEDLIDLIDVLYSEDESNLEIEPKKWKDYLSRSIKFK